MKVREFLGRAEEILRRDTADGRVRDFFEHLCKGMGTTRKVDDDLVSRGKPMRLTAIHDRNSALRDGFTAVLGYDEGHDIAPDEVGRLKLATNAAILELLEVHRPYPNYLFETVNRELTRLRAELNELFAEIVKPD